MKKQVSRQCGRDVHSSKMVVLCLYLLNLWLDLVEQVIAAEGVQESTSSVEVSEEKKDKPTSMRPWDRGKIGPVRIVQPFKKGISSGQKTKNPNREG